jgi:hypothetical protein
MKISLPVKGGCVLTAEAQNVPKVVPLQNMLEPFESFGTVLSIPISSSTLILSEFNPLVPAPRSELLSIPHPTCEARLRPCGRIIMHRINPDSAVERNNP